MKKLLVILLLAGIVTAYTNDTMTDSFRKLMYDDPIGAIKSEHIYASGGWFFILLAAAPYLGLWISQGNMLIPHIWLTLVLASYGYLFTETSTPIPYHVFYILTVAWLAGVLYRMFSPKNDL